MRRDDEFNFIKITNEEESFSYEFGGTPNEESSSFRDNSNPLRDEVNDTSVSNDDHRPEEEKKRKEDNNDEQIKEATKEVSESSSSSSSSSSAASSSASTIGRTVAGGASAGATVTAVIGASIIAVSTLSGITGLNVFLNTTCTMKELKPAATEIAYVLELVDKNEDDFFISLRNDKIEYYSEQGLMEGVNEGVFTDLTPSTYYVMSVFDVKYKNNPIYEETVSTLAEEEVPAEGVVIKFDANGGTGNMETVHLTSLPDGYYSVPECGFTAPSGMTFNFWAVTMTEYGTLGLYPGTHIENFREQEMTFVAHWRQASPEFPVSVHLDPGDAGGDEIIEVRGRGEEYAMPETPFTPPTDMKFAYWVDAMADTTELRKLNPYEIITLDYEEEAYFTAFWEDLSPSTDPEFVTISFVANNGTDEVMESIRYPYKTEFTLPPCEFSDPDDHMMFGGWMINGTTGPLKTASWVITIDTVLTATWVACYRMTYYADNGTDETYVDKVAETETLYDTLKTCPFTAPSGMELVGWLLDDDAGQTEVTLGGYISNESDRTFHANWGELPSYHVSFDANGGFGSMEPYETDVLKGETFILPPCDYEAPEETKTFAYWYVNGEEYQPNDEITIMGETIILAMWKDKTSHSISYLPGEYASGDAYIETVYEEDNPNFLLEAVPDQFVLQDGYALLGWEIAGVTYDPGDQIDVTADIEATALWQVGDSSFNGISFYGLYDVDEYTYLALQLDFIDPSSHFSDFVLHFTEGVDYSINLNATTEVQEYTIPSGTFASLSSGMCSYYLDYEDEGVSQTWGSGSSLNINSLYCMDPDIELASFNNNLIYWNDNNTSHIAATLNHRVYNNHGYVGELYLRFKQYNDSDYEYVQLADRPGMQLIALPFQLTGSSSSELYNVELVGTTDGENYQLYQNFCVVSDSLEFMQITDAATMGAYMDPVIPSSSASATAVRLDLFGCALSNLDATFTLQFEFTNYGDGGNVTFTLVFTPTSQDMANGYVLLDLTQLSNSMDLTYDAFVASAQVYACTVTLVNSVQSNTITLYNQYNFSVS